jgi:hypothetical protein
MIVGFEDASHDMDFGPSSYHTQDKVLVFKSVSLDSETSK